MTIKLFVLFFSAEFKLICRTRTFVFFAPTAEEKNGWVKVCQFLSFLSLSRSHLFMFTVFVTPFSYFLWFVES
jgi:hypothetical protein